MQWGISSWKGLSEYLNVAVRTIHRWRKEYWEECPHDDYHPVLWMRFLESHDLGPFGDSLNAPDILPWWPFFIRCQDERDRAKREGREADYTHIKD